MPSDTIRVIVAINFSDDIMAQLRAVSPRYHIERHYPNVPDSAIAEAEVLYTLGYFPDPARAPRLRWIQMHTAGIDHALNQPIMQAEDVEITTISGIHATPMAEYCLMMMLAFAYKLPTMLRLQAQAEWPARQHSLFAPRELRGQTVGIVGYGSIGRELARLADSLGMTVLAAKRDVMHPELPEDRYQEAGIGDPSGEIPARLYPPEALSSMASECDFLVLITPLTGSTRHLIGEDVLNAMKKTAVLINVARGSVVDEKALISALAAGRIGGAALDVFEEEPLPATSPLWNMDNVIISPHVAGNSSRYNEKAAALFAENLQRYIEKRPLLNRLERKRGY
ncbi:MAG: D-2-hydroxyacid dehydrogenase [Chloroflexi bacterium]|nr:D-2-hydroxyacid dehydrogenase [Chloroflexota bacterium]